MNTEQIRRRIGDFPEPVRDLRYTHPIVQRITDMYAHGQIITLDEALCQMVVAIASDAELSRKREMDLMMRSTLPAIYPTP